MSLRLMFGDDKDDAPSTSRKESKIVSLPSASPELQQNNATTDESIKLIRPRIKIPKDIDQLFQMEISPELKNLLSCVICQNLISHPFMQCLDGHLMCRLEGERLQNCPCGAGLLSIKLRWLRHFLDRVNFSVFKKPE